MKAPRFSPRSIEILETRIAPAATYLVSAVDVKVFDVTNPALPLVAANDLQSEKDAATNVLSFPAGESRTTRGIPLLLGDIVIAYETTEREARAEHKPFMDHLIHLAVHGFLHLAGYDHPAHDQAAAMERLEAAILARLGVPDPYLARGAA